VSNDVNKSPFALPHLKEIFDKLRRGRHICAEDGVFFYDLKDNLPAFTDLFSNIGFRLETHQRDFFYFHGEGNLSETSIRMGVFVFILMEHLTSIGEPVEESVMTKTFAIGELPHLKSERYRAYMAEAGVDSEDALANIIANLDNLGFARRRGDAFVFRAPVYRFFDVCLKLAKPEEGKK